MPDYTIVTLSIPVDRRTMLWMQNEAEKARLCVGDWLGKRLDGEADDAWWNPHR